MTTIEICNELRDRIKRVDDDVSALRYSDVSMGTTHVTASAVNSAIGEFRANVTIAHRHLEDARMRLGKAIQALDGGVSCYDKKP